MIQFQENAWTDRRMDGRKDKRTKGQTDPISKDPSGYPTSWGPIMNLQKKQ